MGRVHIVQVMVSRVQLCVLAIPFCYPALDASILTSQAASTHCTSFSTEIFMRKGCGRSLTSFSMRELAGFLPRLVPVLPCSSVRVTTIVVARCESARVPVST